MTMGTIKDENKKEYLVFLLQVSDVQLSKYLDAAFSSPSESLQHTPC